MTNPQPFKPLNVGLIGAGRMGQLYARIVNESRLGRIVGLVGNTPDTTNAAAQRLGVTGYSHANYGALWANHALDAVIIATPEWDHLTPTLQALDQGLHILLEKPMTHQLGEAEAIFKLAQGNGRVFMLCHVLRFDPRFAVLQRLVKAGELGTIKNIYARRSTDQDTFKRIQGRCHPAYWLSPHDVDLMRWITGAEVTRVRAHSVGSGKEYSDGLLVDLWFNNGAVARFENTWVAPPLNGLWRWGQFDIEGTTGRADITPSEQGFMVYQSNGSVNAPDTLSRPELHGRVRGAFAELTQHFLEAALGYTQPIMSAADGLITVRVAAAIERSLQENQALNVES